MSLAAIIISIVFGIVNDRRTVSINKINLEAKYYDSIFESYLIDRIPKTRNNIQVHDKVVGIYPLFMVIDNFLKDIIYFKYREEEFYYKLYNQLISLEDYMAKINDENDNLNADVIYRQLDDKIKAIYDTIFSDYGSSK